MAVPLPPVAAATGTSEIIGKKRCIDGHGATLATAKGFTFLGQPLVHHPPCVDEGSFFAFRLSSAAELLR
jgi:hypothetical protein